MTRRDAIIPRLESLLAMLLRYGTWLASGLIGVGVTLALLHALPATDTPSSLGLRLITAGIVCFILLPVCRVAIMLVVFIVERDFRFVAIAAAVLAIILAGFALGTRSAKTQPHAGSSATHPAK
ncbi:MAG TPA: DUF1634 domain-containing protein [Candidatus Angelobacter sp.]|nr:DUF1634 domain-containing protein [Candidatus Angelobacter sp.]